jgi:hypothetical protein
VRGCAHDGVDGDFADLLLIGACSVARCLRAAWSVVPRAEHANTATEQSETAAHARAYIKSAGEALTGLRQSYFQNKNF